MLVIFGAALLIALAQIHVLVPSMGEGAAQAIATVVSIFSGGFIALWGLSVWEDLKIRFKL